MVKNLHCIQQNDSKQQQHDTILTLSILNSGLVNSGYERQFWL